jgi:hypothetical protein
MQKMQEAERGHGGTLAAAHPWGLEVIYAVFVDIP